MKFVLTLILSCIFISTALAAPTKKDATAFVKEVEAAVKANQKALVNGPDAIRKHNRWYKSLGLKADALFVDADTCSSAYNAANSMWSTQLQYHIRPDELGYKFNMSRLEDYGDNMKLCKESLRRFK
jgi:hypothetical protein